MAEDSASTAPEHSEAPEISVFGPFRFDRRNGLLVRGGTETPLAAKQRDLLECLLERPGSVVAKQELLERLWPDTVVTDHSLTEAVRALRKTLGDDPRRPRFIQTVHRKGYRFIAEVRRVDSSERSDAARGTGKISPRWIAIAAAALIVVALGIGWLLTSAGDIGPAEPRIRRFELTSAGGMLFGVNHLYAGIALSDDGMTVAYLSQDEHGVSLFVQRLDRDEPVRVPTTGSPYQPSLSPDGNSVAFFEWSGISGANKSSLKIADARGGTPVVVAEGLTAGSGASFTADGRAVVFTALEPAGLWRVAADGTTDAQPIFAADPDEVYRWPQVLPGVDTVVVTSNRYATDEIRREIVALSLASGTRRVLLESGGRARLTGQGYLLVGRDRQLFAASLDESTQRVSGRLVPVLADVATDEFSGYAAFDLAADGTLIYLRDRRAQPRFRMTLVDQDGADTPIAEIPSFSPTAGIATLSPDARHVAFTSRRDRTRDIYVADLERGGSPTQVTFGQWAGAPIWTPEGHRLTYGRLSGAVYDLYSSTVDTRQAELLLSTQYSKYPSSWSPDGRQLLYTENHPETGSDIWILRMDTREPVPFLKTEDEEWGPVFSPDGRYVAYHTNESGQYTVWIRPVPEDLSRHDPDHHGPAWKVSPECGAWPTWSPDGKQLFFRHCRGTDPEPFSVASVEMGPEPVIGHPRRLFAGNFAGRVYGAPGFSVAPDGRLLLSTLMHDGAPEEQLHLELIPDWSLVELENVMTAGR